MSYPKPYTMEDLNRYEVIPTEFRSYISGQRLIATVEALERVTRERDEARAGLADEMRCASEDRIRARADAARLREALESIVVIGERCNCDGYCGPCGCGERAEDVAREALGEVES